MKSKLSIGQMRFQMFGVCMALMGISTAWAGTTIRVAPGGNDANDGSTWPLAKATIQAAVNAAVSGNGDTVLVSNGTYTLTSQISVAKNVRVTSLSGRDVTFINGNYPTTTNRAFYITHDYALVDGFTITNAHTGAAGTDRGGAVRIEYGTISNCVISACGTDSGNAGGVYLNVGGTAIACVISNNTCPGYGGGVYLSGVATKLDNCEIVTNRGQYGGGVGIYNGIVTNCTIKDNWVSGGTWYLGGGGVYLESDVGSGGTIDNCRILSNSASVNVGGGLYVSAGKVRSCTISGNSVGYGGGGVYVTGLGAYVLDCTIASNSTSGAYDAGGIYINSTGVTVDACRVVGNIVQQYAGGVRIVSGSVIKNSLIWGNKAARGGGLRFESGGLAVNCTIASNTATSGSGNIGGGVFCNGGGSLTNCIVWLNRGDTTTNNYYNSVTNWGYSCTTPLVEGIGNIDSDPLLADIASGDCHLKSRNGRWTTGDVWVMDAVHSPCIDKGDPASAYSLEPSPNGARINMGAYGNTTQASKTLFHGTIMSMH